MRLKPPPTLALSSAPLLGQRIGAETVGPGTVPQGGHPDKAPDENYGREHRHDQGNRSIRQILGETGRDKKGRKSTSRFCAIVQPLWLMRPLKLRYQVQSIGDLSQKRAEQARSRSGSLVAQDWRGFD